MNRPVVPRAVSLAQRALERLDGGGLVPDAKDRGHFLAGCAWHQGWNDRINDRFNAEYASNLAHFIRDVRRDLARNAETCWLIGTGLRRAMLALAP